ncbi:MAG: hypothetical protein ABIH78_00835 [Candidatus Peregrinibacteria bacterium]
MEPTQPTKPAQPTMPAAPVAPASILKPEEKSSFLIGNKGIIIAVILGIVALIVGIGTLKNIGSSDQYQGFIKKAEQVVNESAE